MKKQLFFLLSMLSITYFSRGAIGDYFNDGPLEYRIINSTSVEVTKNTTDLTDRKSVV